MTTQPLRLIDRRAHPRFVVEPMYTPICVRPLDRDNYEPDAGWSGHAYDISEGGLRFELDRPIKPGTRVAMQITLPSMHADIGPGRSIFVFANVVWIDDEDEPGPARMAAVITDFVRAGDRERLLRQFASGRYRAAA